MAAASVPAAVSPPPGAGPVPHHPPYKEMIVRAIESLKEKNGSSRAAISKYIAVNYFGLPLKHEALLTTHIHRLKKNGVISARKHSYMMSGDVSGATKRRVTAGDSSRAPVVAPKRRGRPAKADLANLASPLPKRGRHLKAVASGGRRGRPPKMAILADAAAAATELTEKGNPAPGRRPGRPPKVRPVRLIFPAGLKLGPASKLATQRSKRQVPGRPRKGLGGGSAAPLLKKRRLGQLRRGSEEVSTALAVDVDGSLGERRRSGRPKKILQPGVKTASGVVASVGKRKPGRPAKATNSVSGNVEGSGSKRRPGRLSNVGDLVSRDVDGSVRKRKPGRPAKFAHLVSGHVDRSVGKRKPGRSAEVAYLVSGGVEGSVGKRRPGRPSKAVHPVSLKGSTGKRKPGRPVKTVLPVSADVEGSVGKKPAGFVSAEVAGFVSVAVEGSVSAEVEGSVGKRKPGRPAKAASPESGDVEGSARKRNSGQPTKVVEREPGLSLVARDEMPTEKRKSRPSQKLLQISFGSENGAAGASSRKRKRAGGRPKKVAEDSADKKKLSQPQKITKQSLNSANGCVEASAGKRKQGRPRKIVLPNLNPVDGALEISCGNKKPKQLKKAMLPDLNLANEDFAHQADTDQHAGAVGSVGGKLKMVREFPDNNMMFGSVDGLPKESANGEGDTPIKLQNDAQTGLNGDGTKGRAVVNGGGTTLLNSPRNTIGKRKLGQPKKLSQVDEDTTLLTQIQTSSGKLVGVPETASDPVPAAVDVLLGMRNPGTSSGKVSTTYSAAVEDGGDAEGLKLGADGPVALTASAEKQQPGRAQKLISSPAMSGNGNVVVLNPVLSSPGDVARDVEIVMPTFKRRPVKKIR